MTIKHDWSLECAVLLNFLEQVFSVMLGSDVSSMDSNRTIFFPQKSCNKIYSKQTQVFI